MAQQLLAKASRGHLLPSARASFAPRSGIGHARGPWEVPGALSQVTLARHLAPSDALPQPPHPLAGPHYLGMCLQGSQSAGRHLALTQELRPWEQAWRSGI